MRPVEGPNVQRPRSKTNKLYYYQGYHDGSIKYKKKPPKGMYINHDDVLKLAAQDLNEVMTPRKQPVPQKFDLLADCERELNILYSQVRRSCQEGPNSVTNFLIIFKDPNKQAEDKFNEEGQRGEPRRSYTRRNCHESCQHSMDKGWNVPCNYGLP